MGKQILAVALVFFAMVGMAAAAASVQAPSPDEPIQFEKDFGSPSGSAVDAAPVGGPVGAGVFPDLTPAVAPASSGAAALGVATLTAGVAVGSFFFF